MPGTVRTARSRSRTRSTAARCQLWTRPSLPRRPSTAHRARRSRRHRRPSSLHRWPRPRLAGEHRVHASDNVRLSTPRRDPVATTGGTSGAYRADARSRSGQPSSTAPWSGRASSDSSLPVSEKAPLRRGLLALTARTRRPCVRARRAAALASAYARRSVHRDPSRARGRPDLSAVAKLRTPDSLADGESSGACDDKSPRIERRQLAAARTPRRGCGAVRSWASCSRRGRAARRLARPARRSRRGGAHGRLHDSGRARRRPVRSTSCACFGARKRVTRVTVVRNVWLTLLAIATAAVIWTTPLFGGALAAGIPQFAWLVALAIAAVTTALVLWPDETAWRHDTAPPTMPRPAHRTTMTSTTSALALPRFRSPRRMGPS